MKRRFGTETAPRAVTHGHGRLRGRPDAAGRADPGPATHEAPATRGRTTGPTPDAAPDRTLEAPVIRGMTQAGPIGDRDAGRPQDFRSIVLRSLVDGHDGDERPSIRACRGRDRQRRQQVFLRRRRRNPQCNSALDGHLLHLLDQRVADVECVLAVILEMGQRGGLAVHHVGGDVARFMSWYRLLPTAITASGRARPVCWLRRSVTSCRPIVGQPIGCDSARSERAWFASGTAPMVSKVESARLNSTRPSSASPCAW